MRKLPKIGQRVRYPGSEVVGPCEGVVHAIYPTRDYDEDADGEPIGLGRERPVTQWHVGVTVEKLPEKWCYTGTNRFAPCVAELELAR